MTKLRILSAAAAAAAALLLAATALPAAAHGPGPGFGPGFAPRPPAHRPVWHRPPPPRPHSWRSRDRAWVWGPLAAGALVYGAAAALRDEPPVTTYVIPQTQPYPGNSSTSTTTTTTTTTTTNTVFWCEAEQGWWPQVRACPTGWKAMPAP